MYTDLGLGACLLSSLSPLADVTTCELGGGSMTPAVPNEAVVTGCFGAVAAAVTNRPVVTAGCGLIKGAGGGVVAG